MSSSEASQYEPKPTLSYAAKVGLQAGAIGAFVSTLQNALGTHSHGAAGIVTRTGGTIGFFGTLHSPLLSSLDNTFGSVQLQWGPRLPWPNLPLQTIVRKATRLMALLEHALLGFSPESEVRDKCLLSGR
jgi:hypothetical protein